MRVGQPFDLPSFYIVGNTHLRKGGIVPLEDDVPACGLVRRSHRKDAIPLLRLLTNTATGTLREFAAETFLHQLVQAVFEGVEADMVDHVGGKGDAQ